MHQLEGEARISLTIDRDGKIVDYTILQKTGYSILDSEIPDLIKRLNPLPAPPIGTQRETVRVVLPVNWRLR